MQNETGKAPSVELIKQFTYQTPNAEQVARMAQIRQAGMLLAATIETNVAPCADRSTAIRKIREAVMTANAGIVLE